MRTVSEKYINNSKPLYGYQFLCDRNVQIGFRLFAIAQLSLLKQSGKYSAKKDLMGKLLRVETPSPALPPVWLQLPRGLFIKEMNRSSSLNVHTFSGGVWTPSPNFHKY